MSKDVMTERQRVEALLNYKRPDRVPIWPFVPNGFAVLYNNLTIADAYTNPEGLYYSLRKTCQDFGWVFFPWMGYASFGAWEFGGDIKMPSGEYDQAPVVTRHPVEKEEDLPNLKMPEPDAGFFPTARSFSGLARQERLDNEPFNAVITSGVAYGISCQIAGVDKFLKWLIRKPGLVHDLIRQISEWNYASLPLQKEMFGTEGVLGFCGGPWGSNKLISPKQFAEFTLPDIKEGQARLRALGYKTTYVHICGEHNANLPYWAQVDFGDPGIIGIGAEIELEKAAEYFPDNIILGNLDPAIVQTGTPEGVYEATKECVERGKQLGCGYIFSTGCDLPPRAPVENVKMMTKAVEDYGWY